MLQIRTTIDNEYVYLDLYKNEPVFLSLSFAELQDITKKNSNFSKSFSLPGSKNNNETFNFFYDLNAVPTNFNPNDKFNASLLWDGYEIMTGYIRLNSVSISDGEIIYQVSFYNQIGDLMANIGDKFLFDLDLDYLSHPYSPEVILQSNLDPNLFPLTGATNYSYQNGKTMWALYNIGYEYISANTVNATTTPLVQFSPTISGTSYTPVSGNFDFSGTPVRDFYYKPSIQVKELYTAIVNQAGYKIESNFFDTAYLQRYYLPLKFADETIYSKNAIPACYKYTNPTLTSVGEAYTTNPSSGVQCNSLGFSANTTTLMIQSGYTGSYKIRFTFDAIGTNECIFSPNTAAFIFNDGTTNTSLFFGTFCDTVSPTQVSFEQEFIITGQSYLSFFFVLNDVVITNYTQEIISSPRFIPNGAMVDYSIEFPVNDYKQLDFITSVNRYFNLIVVPNPDKPDYLIVEPIVDYIGTAGILDWTTKVDFNENQALYPTTALLNGTLEFNFKLDQDYTNQDFNGQANRIFGTDKFLLNLQYKDAVTKFDYIFSSPIDITVNNSFTPLITLSSMSKLKQIDVGGVTQQTFVPFKILPKLVFRGPTMPVDNYGYIASSAQTSSESCRESTIMVVYVPGWLKWYDCVGVQHYGYFENGTYDFGVDCIEPYSIEPGTPYAETAAHYLDAEGTACTALLNFDTFQYYYMNETQVDRFTNINRFTTYPFSYTGFSHYTNFRGEDKTNVTPAEYSFNAPDLYNIYYEDYVNDIVSEENKIYSCKIYLYPQDIQSLRWNEKILINNSFFRINKIANFNALEPSVCDVELVKLTKTYNPHPILYYKLTSCEEPPILYSNSDLMYNLYAYIGNYVRLYDDDVNYLGCYLVEQDTYGSAKDYQHYYISSGYTNDMVGVYPDCACTGRTQFNIVQQEPVETAFFYYIGYDCDTLTTQFQFKSTGSTLSSSDVVKIHNSVTNFDACITNIELNYLSPTDWIEVQTFVDCETCAFVPTPSPTPTPLPCVLCVNYSVYNPSPTTGVELSYVPCGGITPVTITVGPEVDLEICACEDSLAYEGTLSVSSIGLCSQPNPSATPTPTPTRTPPQPTATPTPTRTPTFTCRYYTFTGNDYWNGSYTACDGTQWNGATLFRGQSVCARVGSVINLQNSLTVGALCY
jgi:hypothetical protein